MLQGKRIAIDTSIYIYKYMADNELFENMYIFISLFLKYKITPIFIFDGKPPKMKEECIAGRLDEKYKAITKINELQELVHTKSKEQISKELQHYKKKSLIVKDKHIKELKAMMDAFNVTYITAEEEADPICAYLTKSGQVWACLSDDMDMFVYGCPRVLRLFNLKKENVFLYNTQEITREINVKESLFPKILLLLGTDYQTKNSGITMHKALNWYLTFSCSNPQEEFYSWLTTKGYLNEQQKQELQNVLEVFLVEQKTHLPLESIKPIQWNVLQNILLKYGFLFLSNIS
jgi:5'-3' exonuclease